MSSHEVKKMRQGMSYSCKEKTIILNVFKYFKLEYTDLSTTEVVRRTARATGCSEKSIFRFRTEEASVEGFKEPSKTKVRKKININSRDVKYDANVRQSIKDIINVLKSKEAYPSLSVILREVNQNPDLPSFSVMTLRRLLFDMGYCYEKIGNKAVLVEKQVNVQAVNNLNHDIQKQGKQKKQVAAKKEKPRIKNENVPTETPIKNEAQAPIRDRYAFQINQPLISMPHHSTSQIPNHYGSQNQKYEIQKSDYSLPQRIILPPQHNIGGPSMVHEGSSLHPTNRFMHPSHIGAPMHHVGNSFMANHHRMSLPPHGIF